MKNIENEIILKSGHFFLVLCIIFISLIIFRAIYSNPIEFNDESIYKWELGRAIFETKDWSLFVPKDSHETHHELRWAVIIPQMLLAVLSPAGYASYFVTPILFFSLFTVLCIALYGRKIEALLFGAVLGLVISFEPMGHVMASQLNTGAFGLLYVIASFWCLLKYLEAGGLRQIFFCAVLCFLAYGAHITYLVFWLVPGAFLIINKKDYKGAIFFLSFLVVAYVFETWVFTLISNGEIGGGRVDRILTAKPSGVHVFRGGDPIEVGHFITRWQLIPKYDFLIMSAFLMGSLSLIFSQVRKAMPPGIWLCFYGALIYGLAVSFPIINLSPIRLALDLHSRYLALFFPLASVFVVWVVYFFVSYCGEIVQRLVPVLFIFILSSVFIVGTVTVDCLEEVQDMQWHGNFSGKVTTTYCKIIRYSQEQNVYPKPSAFVFRAQNYYAGFNEDYISGKVALFGNSRIGVFRAFVRVQFPNASFIETENGWYSIDGEDKSRCVMELGQTEAPNDNYRDCMGQKMGRRVFN